jgi:beta-barrel assembly-enhancing protease
MHPHLGGWRAPIKRLCFAAMFVALLLIQSTLALDDDIGSLLSADRRLVQVGRRLARGGVGLCASQVSNPGWVIADVEQFPPSLRRRLRALGSLQEFPRIVWVEPDSAADRAEVRAGDDLLAVGGAVIPGTPSVRASRSRMDRIERSEPSGSVLVRRGSARLTLKLGPEPGCSSHFVIGQATGLRGVSSNGRLVGISFEMLNYVANDDELALILAHELAHNILGHNKGVPSFRAAGEDRSGRSKKSREAEADRWALYLMARAGYDVSVAPGFWRRWGPKTSFGIFNSGSHPGWRERADAAEAEIARIKAQQQAGQQPIP